MIKIKTVTMKNDIYNILERYRFKTDLSTEAAVKELLILFDVSKASYCDCESPLIRTNVPKDEYCAACGNDIEQ